MFRVTVYGESIASAVNSPAPDPSLALELAEMAIALGATRALLLEAAESEPPGVARVSRDLASNCEALIARTRAAVRSQASPQREAYVALVSEIDLVCRATLQLCGNARS